MATKLVPDDFVDTDKAFPDDHNPEQINLAEITVVDSGGMDGVTLVYDCDGHRFLGGRAVNNWGLSMREPYHFSGQTIPIPDTHAKYILEQIGSTATLEEYDWAAQDWTYFE